MKRSLCTSIGALVGSLAVAGLLTTTAHADVDVKIYRDHTTVGDGSPYATLWAEFTSPAVSFGTDNAWEWHPTDLHNWGTDITGCFTAQTTGDYLFGLISDDGSKLFLNNDLITPVVDHGGPTPTISLINAAAPIFLTAGDDIALEIHHFEDFEGDAGLDLLVKGPGDDVSRLVTAQELDCANMTPEPNSLALLATGGLPLLGFLRRRNRKP